MQTGREGPAHGGPVGALSDLCLHNRCNRENMANCMLPLKASTSKGHPSLLAYHWPNKPHALIQIQGWGRRRVQAYLCPKGKEMEVLELVRTGLTEHKRAWDNVASSRNRDVSETVAHSLFLSMQLLQVNTLKLKVSLPQLPTDDHISNVTAALIANDT